MEQELVDFIKEMNITMLDINVSLSGIDSRLDGIDSRLDGIDSRLDGIDSRLDGIDGRLDGIDKRLDGLESQVTENTMILRAIDERVKVNSAELEKVSFSLILLEGNVTKSNETLAIVEKVTARNWSDITLLKEAK